MRHVGGVRGLSRECGVHERAIAWWVTGRSRPNLITQRYLALRAARLGIEAPFDVEPLELP